MAQRLALIQTNVEWLMHFAVSRYVHGVNVALPGKKAEEVKTNEEEKEAVDMDVDEPQDPLLEALKKAFPEYSPHRNFQAAYTAASTHLTAETIQEVIGDPEMLKMLVSALL